MKTKLLFEDITNRILLEIEKGNLAPWRSRSKQGTPFNMFSKHYYQGINYLRLSFEEVSSPSYFTFLQAREHNLRLKSGSKGRLIIFWKAPNQSENELKCPIAKTSFVFNYSDLLDYEEPKPQLSEPQNILAQIFENNLVRVHESTFNKPCFDVLLDKVKIPTINNFENEESYYSSLFHELIHWSGHPSRLHRFEVKFQQEIQLYAYEELIADIGSAYLCSMCGINDLTDTSQYLDGWIKQAKLDVSYIPKAAIQAQKAVNYLLTNNNPS